ncbi:hypothetical protein DACRYDRAFT_107807 [Dacryopinax primogenitus]|uniref:Nucleic acid-binding protein n=1 Tax=Dacryopinax primogenitus (strain DJM 731) TaxID=1858805 RepID=M5FU75_DACPD|nr:uncharacterized protein DACRYDRAFT_107807 [Dacryopinax primogenitus]EJU01251.1 hypothetical protein DACRYDRAFT_107807 [Dacryopinax primogenitus]
MPSIILGWQDVNNPYSGYLHSLDLVTKPEEMAPANHLLVQAAHHAASSRMVFTIVGMGQVPPELVAPHAPVVAQPVPPSQTEIDQLFPISAPLGPASMQHYDANPTFLPSALPQLPVQPFAPPALGTVLVFMNVNTIVAFMKGLNMCMCITHVKLKDHGTINILCHDGTGEIDLVVWRAYALQAGNVEEGKTYGIYNVAAITSV